MRSSWEFLSISVGNSSLGKTTSPQEKPTDPRSWKSPMKKPKKVTQVQWFLNVFYLRTSLSLSLFKDFVYLFLERGGRMRKRERETSVCGCFSSAPPPSPRPPRTWPTTQACVSTGNWTGNSLVPRPMLNPMSHTSQGPLCILKSY